MIIIKNGRVIDATGDRTADVIVDDAGAIAEVGADLATPAGATELDAAGCIVAPGFVDLHAHLRQPGREDAETIETGARGAALGGFTAIVAMPNTAPCMDSAAVIREVLDLGATAMCEVVPSAAITVGRDGEALSPMAELAGLGVRIFTDDGTGVQDDRLMKRALEYSVGLAPATGGAPVTLAQHCEVTSLSAGGCMHEGEWSSKLGIPGQPAEAEELMVQRDIALSRATGARVHFQHMSTGRSVQLIRDAKAEGLPVTAEATTHHFTLTDAECASYDPVFKVHPPLRTEADVQAVKRGLADGTIDAIATDHAPHTQSDKELPFDQAPPGMLGLESALGLALTELDLDIAQILALLSWNPARIAGIDDRHGGPIEPGRRANIAVLDPDHEWTITGEAMASRSANCPYEGKTVKGKVRHTVYEGELVVIDQEAQR
ncbi:MAG: dihydroorotase [Acidimicrobiales bacterium]|nr:dihydroorotase [Acidimicrobiales bacterium]